MGLKERISRLSSVETAVILINQFGPNTFAKIYSYFDPVNVIINDPG